jgi:predicted nucleic acid-binding protein
MAVPLAGLPLPPPELVFEGSVPSDALFFDTNCAIQPIVQRAQNKGRLTLISSIVYAELTIRRRESKHLEMLDIMLVERALKVVPFDERSARCFFELYRQLDFTMPPLLRSHESTRACRDRLRFDLAIFAAALSHRATLVTNNTNDFQYFPFRQYWMTEEELAAAL